MSAGGWRTRANEAGERRPRGSLKPLAGAAAFGLGLLAPVGIARGAIGFADAVPYPVADTPQVFGVGDFDRDGRKDLAVSACIGEGLVSILRGRRNGKFVRLEDQPGPNCGGPLVVGRFDQNKRPDLVVSDQNNGALHFLKGKGTGDFADPVVSSTDLPTIQGLVARDFDRDGDLDLAATDYANSGGVALIPGNGDGTFGEADSHATDSRPAGLVVADLNRDGRLDLATANEVGQTISVLHGEAGGGFAEQESYPVGNQPFGLASGDFNEDGRLDLVASRRGFGVGGAAVLLQRANGTFKDAQGIGTGVESLAVVTSDVDRDGHRDVAFSNNGVDPNVVTLVRGRGDGSFRPQRDFAVGAYSWGLVAKDFDADRRPDLATADGGSDQVSVLLNQP